MAAAYNRKDRWYQEAKDQGFRSRAAFKLEELQKRFKFLKTGTRVLELGCWPGGWLQYAADTVGTRGRVVGIDLKAVDNLGKDQVVTLAKDIADPELIPELKELVPEGFHVVMSDLAPKLSGIREVDDAGMLELAGRAFEIAESVLVQDGWLVMKLFKGPAGQGFVKTLRPRFRNVRQCELDTTRRTSSEFYLVSQGFQSR